MPVLGAKKILTGLSDGPNLTRWTLIRINVRSVQQQEKEKNPALHVKAEGAEA